MRIIPTFCVAAMTLMAANIASADQLNYKTLKYIGIDGKETIVSNQSKQFQYSDSLIHLFPAPSFSIPFRFSHINDDGERVYYQISQHLDTKVISENKNAFIISENNGTRLRQGTRMSGDKTSWTIYERAPKKKK